MDGSNEYIKGRVPQSELLPQTPTISLEDRKAAIKKREDNEKMRRTGIPLTSNRPRGSIGLRGRIIAGAAALGLAWGFLGAPKPPGQATQVNPDIPSGPDNTPGLVKPDVTLSPEQALIQSNEEILNFINAHPGVRFVVSNGPIAIDFSKAIVETGSLDSNGKKTRVDNKYVTEINGQKVNLSEIYSTNLLFTTEDKNSEKEATWGLIVFKSRPNSQDPNPTEHIGLVHLTPENFPNGLNEYNFSGRSVNDFQLTVNNKQIPLGSVGDLKPLTPTSSNPTPNHVDIIAS